MTLDFRYIADDARPELHISGLQPMYFDGSVNRIRRYMHTQHAGGRIHEPSFCTALVELMSRTKPAVVFDVGAFIGYFSIMAAAASPPETRIYSFEMNAENFRHVTANISVNPHLASSRMIAVCCGVTDASQYAKPITIRGFQMFTGNLDEIDRDKVANPNFTDATESVVDLTSIDDFTARHSVIPDLIKMDIEGWECRAIPGAMHTIRQHMPTLLIEIHADRKLQEFGMTQRDFLTMVRELGYEICLFGDHKQRADSPKAFLGHMSDDEIAAHVEGLNTAIIAIAPRHLSVLSDLIATERS